MARVFCFSCGKETEFTDRIGRTQECIFCRADLHVCKNCQFYDPKVYNECRESSADVVREKDRSNYCDYFSPRETPAEGKSKEDQLREAAEALFKKT